MDSELMNIPSHVMARQVGDETVILDLASGLYFGLDEVGSRVWDLIGRGNSMSAVYETLIAEYEVPPEALREDLQALVHELCSRGLLV
jgi:hypothetical protein